MPVVRIPTARITDWDSFHRVFAEVMGFPEFYGRNMSAWIDCMTCLDDSSAEMTKIHAASGCVVVLRLDHVDELARRCPEQFAAIIDCSAFVNWRRIEAGRQAVLALSFYGHPSRGSAVNP